MNISRETIKNLVDRFWRTGTLLISGLLLIIYIALGFVYIQQGAQQRELAKQIAKLSPIVSKPLPSDEKVRSEYAKVSENLTLRIDQYYVGTIVGIADRSGIDTNPASNKLRIPSAAYSQVTIGEDTYQLISFRNIYVQSRYENVMAFLSDLDSGKTLETMVLTRVALSETSIKYTGEEATRRLEFREVVSAVIEMMKDNSLSTIPNPKNFAGGVATNLMGDDPGTEVTAEGFPDITTSATEKGYIGEGMPKDGYVLFTHDKISPTDNSQFSTVSYIDTLTTEYYYTCEADGVVRQFDGTNAATATEYLSSEESETESVAVINVDIYTQAKK